MLGQVGLLRGLADRDILRAAGDGQHRAARARQLRKDRGFDWLTDDPHVGALIECLSALSQIVNGSINATINDLRYLCIAGLPPALCANLSSPRANAAREAARPTTSPSVVLAWRCETL